MKRYRKFLEPFSKVRKIVITIFVVLLSLSSATLTIFLLMYPSMFANMSGAQEFRLTIVTLSVFVLWFVSAMGLSISSNKALIADKAARKLEKERLYFYYYEQRLANEALRKDLEIIASEKI